MIGLEDHRQKIILNRIDKVFRTTDVRNILSDKLETIIQVHEIGRLERIP